MLLWFKYLSFFFFFQSYEKSQIFVSVRPTTIFIFSVKVFSNRPPDGSVPFVIRAVISMEQLLLFGTGHSRTAQYIAEVEICKSGVLIVK